RTHSTSHRTVPKASARSAPSEWSCTRKVSPGRRMADSSGAGGSSSFSPDHSGPEGGADQDGVSTVRGPSTSSPEPGRAARSTFQGMPFSVHPGRNASSGGAGADPPPPGAPPASSELATYWK